MTFDFRLVQEAIGQVRSQLVYAGGAEQIDCGLVLGSGFSAVADVFETKLKIPFSSVSGLGKATTVGHQGVIIYSESFNMRSLVFSGRRHFYEGAGWTPVVLPQVIFNSLGAKAVVLTSATGGIAPHLRVNDLLLVEDHINFMGSNPLTGMTQHFSAMQKFPDQSHLYDRGLAAIAERASKDCDIRLVRGILAAMCGPSYETPAEIRMLKSWGADAVGMSSVAEAIVANAFGMKVLALSAVTNLASGISKDELTHDEVLQNMALLGPKLQRFISLLWKDMGAVI